MPVSELERQIAAIASLDEPIRRGLYLYVVARRREVGRDEAARAVRISRALAAFHLDKLAELGLLETPYRRLTRRRGPGAGRPAKLYRRASRVLDFTIPARRYEFAGRVFVRAIAEVASPGSRRALERAARAAGRRLASAGRPSARGGSAGPHRLSGAVTGLDECGFEPARPNGEGRPAHCPFEALPAGGRPLLGGLERRHVHALARDHLALGVQQLEAQLEGIVGLLATVREQTPDGRALLVRRERTHGDLDRNQLPLLQVVEGRVRLLPKLVCAGELREHGPVQRVEAVQARGHRERLRRVPNDVVEAGQVEERVTVVGVLCQSCLVGVRRNPVLG